jgi:hypothetical protein
MFKVRVFPGNVSDMFLLVKACCWPHYIGRITNINVLHVYLCLSLKSKSHNE